MIDQADEDRIGHQDLVARSSVASSTFNNLTTRRADDTSIFQSKAPRLLPDQAARRLAHYVEPKKRR